MARAADNIENTLFEVRNEHAKGFVSVAITRSRDRIGDGTVFALIGRKITNGLRVHA